MASEYYIIKPVLENATIAPNPAQINKAILISVSVTEETIYLDPEFFYSGEVFSGEV